MYPYRKTEEHFFVDSLTPEQRLGLKRALELCGAGELVHSDIGLTAEGMWDYIQEEYPLT